MGRRATGRRAAIRAGVVAAVTALALTACGGSDDAFESGDDATTGAATTSLTVGGANFTEMLVLQAMYGALLEKAGYTIDYKTAANREVYAPSLESGEIDVVPEYAATFAEYLNRAKNGPDAATVATADAEATVAAATPLAAEKGLKLLTPAQAASQNGFAVTTDFATQNSVTTLTQLGALKRPLVLAATEECPERPFCQLGLEKTYGLTISKVLPLGFGSPQAKQAVIDGDAQLALVGTTDGTLAQLGLTLLEDDKNLQLADNLVPVVNQESAGDAKVATALEPLAEVLTTDDLAELNRQVDAERKKPEDVAKTYLESKNLL